MDGLCQGQRKGFPAVLNDRAYNSRDGRGDDCVRCGIHGMTMLDISRSNNLCDATPPRSIPRSSLKAAGFQLAAINLGVQNILHSFAIGMRCLTVIDDDERQADALTGKAL